MQELIKQLTSISWWVSVVVAGVLASLAAAYLKPRTDRVIGSVSVRYRRRNEQQAKARAKQIEDLRLDQHEQIVFAILINYKLLRAIHFLVMGSILAVLLVATSDISAVHYSTILSVFFMVSKCLVALAVLIGLRYVSETTSDYEILAESRKSSLQQTN
jgi:hypothetical protein